MPQIGKSIPCFIQQTSRDGKTWKDSHKITGSSMKHLHWLFLRECWPHLRISSGLAKFLLLLYRNSLPWPTRTAIRAFPIAPGRISFSCQIECQQQLSEQRRLAPSINNTCRRIGLTISWTFSRLPRPHNCRRSILTCRTNGAMLLIKLPSVRQWADSYCELESRFVRNDIPSRQTVLSLVLEPITWTEPRGLHD